MHNDKQHRDRRDGVALILVLGFLAILTIMGVAFVINMRTERLTSRVYLDSVRARQLVDVGLVRALNDLNTYLVTNQLFSMTNVYMQSTGGTFSTNLMSDSIVQAHLPAGLPTAPSSTFTNIYADPLNPTQVIGHVAYLVVNLTGLLDVNHAGGAERGAGRSPEEIQIINDFISEVDNDDAWGELREKLSADWGRIDTLREFDALARPAYLDRRAEHFIPFSRSLVERDPDGNPKVNIGGNKADLQARQAEIKDALGKAGIPAAQIDGVYNSLLDYVDTDLIPENPNGLSGEPVPMINEIAVSGSFVKNGPDGAGNYNYRLEDFRVDVEFWYPFPLRPGVTETFNADTNAQLSFITAPGSMPPSAFKDILSALNPTNGLTVIPPPSPPDITVTGRGYYVTSYQFPATSYTTNANYSSGLPVIADFLSLLLSRGGQVVDRVVNPRQIQMPIPPNQAAQRGISCYDPRVNHLSAGDYWKSEQVTLTNRNNNLGEKASSEPIGADPVMYARNFPLNEEKPSVGVGSVAELGYLSIGEPWKTIALYKAPVGQPDTMHPVLDYFTISDSDAKTNGLVNMNTLYTNILNSVFYDMTVQKAPEVEPNLFTNDVNKARELAGALRDLTLTPTNRLSAIGEMSSIFSPAFDASLDNDPAIESIIRNSIGLLTVRDGMYAVIIRSESLSETGDATATERALAFVWRDPQTINGVNETIVRYFTWLSE